MRNALALLLLALLPACAGRPTPAQAPSVALAVRVIGGAEPTRSQLAVVHQALQPHLERAGYRYAASSTAADFIVHVNFTPSSVDPAGGHVAVGGVEPGARLHAMLAADDGGSHSREMRRRLDEIEQWAARETFRP